jgi:hypothetical protein
MNGAATATLTEPVTTALVGLDPDHLADLRRSGLTDATIKAAGLYSARPGDLPRLCGRPIPDGTSGLAFPYSEDFRRVKLFPPLPDADGKAIKYLQPVGSPVRAYIPSDVRPRLDDPSGRLFVTEGEKKALALTQGGFPCIGLGGVWNFRTKELPDDAMIPDLEAVPWSARIVYLVPDADAWTNENVLKAVYRLARLLEARGATILIVKLPSLDGHKTGVDDFLVAKGGQSFRRLVEKAVNLGYPAFKPWREQEKAKARQSEKASGPLPLELADRRIHPASHLDPADGFAAVGILDGKTWRTITSNRGDYPTEAILDALTVPPVNYLALGCRWRPEDRDRFIRGDDPPLSWAKTVAALLGLFRDYLEFDATPPYVVLALWSLLTYLFPALPSFPRLNLHGEKGSGKSKGLRMVAAVAHNGLYRTAPRPAGLFRLIEVLRPTLCLDEIEHLDRDDRGDINAILNAGYQQGGAVDRCVGDEHTVTPFNVYAPIALAGIKGLNAVLSDRCVTLILQPGQDRTRVNRDIDLTRLDPRVHEIRDACYRLALTRWTEARDAWEQLDLPEWLNGRSRELWGPLLALAALVVAEDPRLDLRPALLALARPDAEDRAELPEVATAILTALEDKMDGADSTVIQPGDLADALKTALGYPVTPTVIGLRLKALGFTRDRSRKGGSFYRVTTDGIQAIRDRRKLCDDAGGVYPPAT